MTDARWVKCRVCRVVTKIKDRWQDKVCPKCKLKEAKDVETG